MVVLHFGEGEGGGSSPYLGRTMIAPRSNHGHAMVIYRGRSTSFSPTAPHLTSTASRNCPILSWHCISLRYLALFTFRDTPPLKVRERGTWAAHFSEEGERDDPGDSLLSGILRDLQGLCRPWPCSVLVGRCMLLLYHPYHFHYCFLPLHSSQSSFSYYIHHSYHQHRHSVLLLPE